MSDSGIHEGDYPALPGTPDVEWGPGFEGDPSRPNEFSADAALIIEEGSGEGMTVAGLTIFLARREEGPESSDQHPIAVGIELTRQDALSLGTKLLLIAGIDLATGNLVDDEDEDSVEATFSRWEQAGIDSDDDRDFQPSAPIDLIGGEER